MITTELVNLRAVGTDAANPASGKLVGQARIPVPSTRYPDDEAWIAPLISTGYGRIFRYASGSFSFGGTATPEYIETVVIEVEEVPEPPTTP
jgi:hypothetical protein